jgi:hypothetical protein
VRNRLPLDLLIAGAVTVAAIAFDWERLAFEAQALLLQPTNHVYDGSNPEPEVTIYCDKPNCEPGTIWYEVIVDGAGRPRALLTEGEYLFDPSARARAARAALAARWPAPESGRPFRGFQVVLNAPPERLPTRHVPFPDTEGQPVSITLERVGPYSPYGDYVVTLDSDGDVDFCGPGYIKAPGPHQSRISRAAFDALVWTFREADFFSLDDRYLANPSDGPTYYLRVLIGDQEKTVADYAGREVGMPAVIRSLQKAVDEAADTSRWVGSSEEWTSGGYDAVQCPTGLGDAGGQAVGASPRSAGK